MSPDSNQIFLHRAVQSLRGLALGDALGRALITRGVGTLELGDPPWIYTDDTVMALSIVEQLRSFGHIRPDELATAFGERFLAEPERGYGAVAYWLLSKISAGGAWRELATQPFGGSGSRGNGAAMRAAPIGAYFAQDLGEVAEQAVASACVTHAHPDGQAGAIAVALAAAFASGADPLAGRALLYAILDRMPDSFTREGIVQAAALADADPAEAAQILGTGVDVLSSDTVPFALWVVARHGGDYAAALTCTLSAAHHPESDVDTLGAMVGGIVAMSAPPSTIPQIWQTACEDLPLYFLHERNCSE